MYAALGSMFDEDEEQLSLTRPSWVSEDVAADQPVKPDDQSAKPNDQPPRKGGDEDDGEAAVKEKLGTDTDKVGEADKVCCFAFYFLFYYDATQQLFHTLSQAIFEKGGVPDAKVGGKLCIVVGAKQI